MMNDPEMMAAFYEWIKSRAADLGHDPDLLPVLVKDGVPIRTGGSSSSVGSMAGPDTGMTREQEAEMIGALINGMKAAGLTREGGASSGGSGHGGGASTRGSAGVGGTSGTQQASGSAGPATLDGSTIDAMSVGQLKAALRAAGVDYSGCVEKAELRRLLRRTHGL